jgi:MATE family multidrug resistance protein
VKFFLKNSIHFRETIYLAWPLIIAQVGHIVTGMTDNMFLGKFFGETEQAAGILSNQIFMLLLVFEIGISFAITPLVNDAFLKNDSQLKFSILKNSLILILTISIILFIILYSSSSVLYRLGQPTDVVDKAIPFYNVISLSIIPISLFFVCKQYCEGHNNTKLSMIISLLGNLINILLNYCLITGFSFFPKLGYMGSCWATFIARLLMGLGFLYIIFYGNKFVQYARFKSASLSIPMLKKIFVNGIASGSQFLFEVAAFAICGLMCGSFGKESIDAHGISMGLAAFTYMFTSGISGAATIRVSNFKSLNNLTELKAAGYSAFLISFMVMLFFGLVFLLFNNLLPLAFSSSISVIEISSKLLLFAALFQLFDGIQVTGLGILRGMGDIKFPTWFTFISYWLIAIPLAWFFGFYLKGNVYGVWLSLSISLIFIAISLLLRFKWLTSR